MAVKKSQRIAYGAAPRADLLPEAQRAERRHRETLPKLLLAIVLSAALAGLIWAAGAAQVLFAQQKLSAAETESADLTVQIAQFSDEQKIIGTVKQLSDAREGLAAFEVLFPDVLGEIAQVLPGDVTLVRFTGELKARSEEQASASSGLGGIDLNPLCVADSATVTIEVAGANLGPVPGFLRELESVTGFKCIVATKVEIEEDGGPQKVTVQLALTEEALATRFEEAEE